MLKSFAGLCYGLSQDGWTSSEQIARELGWDSGSVTHYKQIREQLHLRAWNFARYALTKNTDAVKDDDKELVKGTLTIVNWRESDFRALLKHLHCADGDRADERADFRVIIADTTRVVLFCGRRLTHKLKLKTS